ncbi:glycosyltransferase [Paracoccus seriniphilus]|uniref:Glycosyltransferase, GT2 family n=1 Tax=Paracoccus seriniphilus TaxID=184748 RepID=A0A239PXM3_9RHOB|nr:glycosyltransferase [Paracoccus seriniphilus]SNT75015.1 Glycosyltransferase, GT2 family [Paracoccus seriniphilus]
MGRQLSSSENRISVAAIVVTHRRLEKLRETVTRLLEEPIDHLIVFDNASDDGTAEWLRQVQDQRLVVRYSARNLGGAGGFSAAMSDARQMIDADWTVVMDDDGRPEPGAIAAFREMDRSGWDALGAAVFHPDGTVCEMNRPYRNPFWRGREFLRTLGGKGRAGFHLQNDAYRPDAPVVDVDMSSFVGLFLSRNALATAGAPDPRLFIYGDDQLYTLNMRRRGLRIGFAPQIRFEHDTEAQQAASGLVLSPLWKVYYMYRNALIAYRVAAGALFWPLVPVLLIKWRRKSRDYGADAAKFREILSIAVRDGLAGRLERSHDEVLELAK